jgi:dienelactone hydrolase
MIYLEWIWALVTSIILLFMLYLNIKDTLASTKKSKGKKLPSKYLVFVNISLIAFLVISFFELTLIEFFSPVGGNEPVFYTLLAGSLFYVVKLFIDSIKLILGKKEYRFIKEFYILFIAFYLAHGVCIITQPDFEYVKLKNRISIASVVAGNLSPSEKYLGHKAFVLGSTEAPYGYLVYEPEESKSDTKLPLLLFLHGGDETGNSEKQNTILGRAAKHGPSRYIKNEQWNPPIPMIVVSPQTTDGWWRPEMVHEFIEYLIENYPVDKSRIYLTGLSRGGTGSFDYINYHGDESYVAAMLPVATDAFVVNSGDFKPEKFKNTPVWLFINDKDKYVADYKRTAQIIRAIKNHNNTSKVTVFPKHGHDAWTHTYKMTGQGFERPEYDPFDENVYEWLLRHSREE